MGQITPPPGYESHDSDLLHYINVVDEIDPFITVVASTKDEQLAGLLEIKYTPLLSGQSRKDAKQVEISLSLDAKLVADLAFAMTMMAQELAELKAKQAAGE